MSFSPTQQHPGRAQVTVLTLVDGLYEAQALTGGDTLISPQFPDLSLAVAQLLNPRKHK